MTPANARRGTVSQTVTVDGRTILLDVRILNPSERARLVTAITWLAQEESTAGPAAWRAFASDVVAAHVAFTMSERDLETGDSTWWGRVICGAAAALFEANGLGQELRRSLSNIAPSLQDARTDAAISM